MQNLDADALSFEQEGERVGYSRFSCFRITRYGYDELATISLFLKQREVVKHAVTNGFGR